MSSGGNIQVPWNDDYKAKGYEYFDVWAPEMATHYGEVFWTDQGVTSLPDDIVKRFDGKVMAIMGYEQDQVIVDPVGKPGQNPDKDTSVPINWAYNHHYMAWMVGKHSEMKEMPVGRDSYGSGAHGKTTEMRAVPKEDQSGRQFADVAETQQMFSEGNGGESRKSFHGYPAGQAQLIESPTGWHITPMQIDTRNREHGATAADVHKCTNFSGVGENGKPCAGYEPRQARYGRHWGGTLGSPKVPGHYSGILECPCNSRYGGDAMFYPEGDGYGHKTKILEDQIMAIESGTCASGQAFKEAQKCFDAIANLGFNASKITNRTETDPKQPAGCVLLKNADGSADALFNSGGSGTCAKSGTKVGASKSAVTDVGVSIELTQSAASSAMTRGPKGQYCSANHAGIIKSFPAKSASAADAGAALQACETFCKTSASCHACSVDNMGGTGPEKLRWVAIPSCGAVSKWAGAIAGDVSQKASTGTATITLTGPSTKWFGVGFDAVTMANSPYTLVVNGSGVQERKIGTCGSEAEHCPGTVLATSIKVVSNTVVDGVRTVVVSRPQQGATKDHYSFTEMSINYISAQGWDEIFAQHKTHDSLTVSLMEPAGATCVCTTGLTGELCGGANNTVGGLACGKFQKNCAPHSATLGAKGEASGDLLAQRNPTCNSAQYSGGLSCCHHGRVMLDSDQPVPDHGGTNGQDGLLRYHMKWRFWFQEYKPASVADNAPASHLDLPRIYFQTEANAGEYDIPPAFHLDDTDKIVGYPEVGPYPELTPGSSCTGNCPHGDDCSCIHTITYNHTVSNMRLIYAGGHCHAPACIGIWLYRNDPGHEMELLCHQAPIYGSGTGQNSVSGMYDEEGYLSLPPCLWGDDEGLEPSVLLPAHTELVSVKKNKNSASLPSRCPPLRGS